MKTITTFGWKRGLALTVTEQAGTITATLALSDDAEPGRVEFPYWRMANDLLDALDMQGEYKLRITEGMPTVGTDYASGEVVGRCCSGLIAAAPDMLEALEDFVTWYNRAHLDYFNIDGEPDPNDYYFYEERMVAAIAKAKGEKL